MIIKAAQQAIAFEAELKEEVKVEILNEQTVGKIATLGEMQPFTEWSTPAISCDRK